MYTFIHSDQYTVKMGRRIHDICLQILSSIEIFANMKSNGKK